MAFKEKLKVLRTRVGLTQPELAKKAGITVRTLQRYESGVSYPKMDTVQKLADALETSVENLLDREDRDIIALGETEGARTQRDFLKQAERFSALMAGGEIPEEDKEAAFMMIMKAYTIAKEKNQVFTPKKYRKPKKNNSATQ